MFGFDPSKVYNAEVFDEDTLWWGARAIFHDMEPEFELLHDRQQFSSDADADEFDRLCIIKWLNEYAFPKLRQRLKKHFLSGRSREVVTIENDSFILLASPQGSCGYLYLGAFRRKQCPATHASNM